MSERVQSAILSMEKAYATMSKRAYYDPSLVSIKSGSQMESKWKEEIAKHASTGSSFDFVEAGNFDITMESETRGKASYTSVIRGLVYEGYYQSTMHVSFDLVNGKPAFYNEYETDSRQIEYGGSTQQVSEQTFINAVVSNDRAYHLMSQRGYYDPSLVSIRPGSQMETKWRNETAKHASTGSSFAHIESSNFSVVFDTPTSGHLSYTCIIKGLVYGGYYRSRAHQKFVIENRRVIFYEETESENVQIEY